MVKAQVMTVMAHRLVHVSDLTNSALTDFKLLGNERGTVIVPPPPMVPQKAAAALTG